jgi:hypothetical protein
MYSHPGNGYFRQLVEQRRHLYLDAAPYKCEKRLISGEIVQAIHTLNPPGRFLARLSGRKRRQQGQQVSDITWYEVSYDKAREKACQSLRERAPPLSVKIEIHSGVEVESGRRNTASRQRTSGLSVMPAIVFHNTSTEVNAARAAMNVSPVPDVTFFTKEEIDLLILISEQHVLSEVERELMNMQSAAEQTTYVNDRQGKKQKVMCSKTSKVVTKTSEESWWKTDSRIDWIN